MKNKSDYYPSNDNDFRDGSNTGIKFNTSKFEHDLFKEEDNIANLAIRVKRVTLPNKGENWKISEDTKVVQVIEGIRFNLKEREFMRTIDGITFILQHYKRNWKSLSFFKKELKLHLKQIAKESKKRKSK